MVVTKNRLCPHCARPAAEGGGASRDHIFPEAFGGQGTIVACTDCNSGIGSGVEGKLLGPESPFTLFLHGSGLPHGRLKATHPQLGQFMVDLRTGEHTARTSVDLLDTDAEGAKTFRIFGGPEEVARIRAGLDRKYGSPEVLKEEAGSPESEPEWLQIDLSTNVADLRRLVAKTALCALTFLQGDSFVTTELADWLRAVLDAPREWPKPVRRSPQPDPDGEEAATRTFDTVAIETRAQALATERGVDLVDASAAAAALLIAVEPRYSAGPRTGFIMSLMGWILPTGLFAPGVPSKMWSPTFLVQNHREPIKIVDFAQGLANGYEA
jgi:HNH endonuclease